MIDHVALKVSNYEASKAFYAKVLAPLGYALMMEHGISGAGFGRDGKPDLWIQSSDPSDPSGPLHLAIAAADRASVDAFHRAAMEDGARDHGAPGPRTEYHPTYYGAFVLDPDGNNLEAVCHQKE